MRAKASALVSSSSGRCLYIRLSKHGRILTHTHTLRTCHQVHATCTVVRFQQKKSHHEADSARVATFRELLLPPKLVNLINTVVCDDRISSDVVVVVVFVGGKQYKGDMGALHYV